MPGDPASVAVVTDSTAYLPDDLAAAANLTIVPLTVVMGGMDRVEGVGVTPEEVARALRSRRSPVTTSRPAPERFGEVYRRAFDEGARGVLSVHLSGRLSGTCDAARLAAAEWNGRVVVIDSGLTGMGLGFAALAAGHAASGGADLDGTCDAARDAISRTTVLFYVDSLEYLRRGGRISAARAFLGTALVVRPVLHMSGGEIVVAEKVRTVSRALARLVDLAVEAADSAPVDIVVHHLDTVERADQVAALLTDRLGDRVRSCRVVEVGAVVAAHAGPGLLSVVIHRCA